MKSLFAFLFILINIIASAQAKLDIATSYSVFPFGANTPTSPVTFSTNVSLNVTIYNSGNATFNGSFDVVAKRDTLNGIILDTITISQSIPAGSGTTTTINFTPSSGTYAFKSGGNGNTIVVWPLIKSGTGLNGDSLRQTIWVNDPSSVFEFEKNQFKLYPNPVINELTIKPLSGINYKRIIIYDAFARKVKEVSFKETIDVSELHAGSYWMIINSEDKSYRVNFIKE